VTSDKAAGFEAVRALFLQVLAPDALQRDVENDVNEAAPDRSSVSALCVLNLQGQV